MEVDMIRIRRNDLDFLYVPADRSLIVGQVHHMISCDDLFFDFIQTTITGKDATCLELDLQEQLAAGLF